MAPRLVPAPGVAGVDAAAASADHRGTQAAMAIFERGGNAVDAAIAANAVLTVTAPHLCGLGGDLFALVHDGKTVHALNASGRAGSGTDAAALRTAGFTAMPFRHHPAAVTIPGCVDGWTALHERFGSLPLGDVLARAIELARRGTFASPLLVASLQMLDDQARPRFGELVSQVTGPNAVVARPGIARTLEAVADAGRDAFYGGEFGAGLVQVSEGMIRDGDLSRSQADWIEVLSTDAFGVRLHTIPPNSQGYLTLAMARVAELLGVPDETESHKWLTRTVESAVKASIDRPDVLHDAADGAALVEEAARRAEMPLPDRWPPARDGDTTYLCTAQAAGLAVSLIQSNASGFGSLLVEPNTSINLQNRGLGFSLVEGHPAELAPGRRPPHTLSPALVTDSASGALRSVIGTMGGDAQPQILLQLLARLFVHGESPASAIAAPRWVLRGPRTGFDTWDGGEAPSVVIEAHAPDAWRDPVEGHETRVAPAFTSEVGHANLIVAGDDGLLYTAADPRAVIGSAAAR